MTVGGVVPFDVQPPAPSRVTGAVDNSPVLYAHLLGMNCQPPLAGKPWCRKELGHVMLHSPEARTGDNTATCDPALHRGIAEVEAESVALMIGAAHGLDTSAYTIPYVSSWASSVPGSDPVEVIKSTAERVRTTAVRVLDQLDTAQIGNGDPPGLDRTATATRAAPERQQQSVVEPQVVGL